MAQTQQAHDVFATVAEMLEPTALARLLGHGAGEVTVAPLVSNGFSSNEVAEVGMGDERLVLKRLCHDDWMALVMRDDGCRSVAVWQTGLLDELEPGVRHGIVAASRDGADHALLMRDCRPGLHDGYNTRAQLEQSLVALVGMHVRFWDDDRLDDPAYELCDIETMLAGSWPRHWPRLDHHADTVSLLREGWQALLDMVAPDVRATIEHLHADPAPLVRALEAEPATLVHGDWRNDNLAYLPDGSMVALDWQMATRGPGVVDLAWLAMSNDAPELRPWVFARYRELLVASMGDRLDLAAWDRSLALAQLGEVLRKGNWHALFASRGADGFTGFREGQLGEYEDAVRRGAELL